MMIYFYATKRLDDIHCELMTTNSINIEEKLVSERDLIEEEIQALYEELTGLILEI